MLKRDKKLCDEKKLQINAQAFEEKPNAYGRVSSFFGVFRTISTIYSFVAAFSLIGMFFYAFALVLILIGSCLTLLAVPSFMALFNEGEKAVEFCRQLFSTLPFGAITMFVTAVFSTIFVSKNKQWEKQKGVQTRNISAIVLSIIFAIIYGGVFWLIKSGNLEFA
ncbi:MAG: hypothetical protein RR454_07345 [Clostridia bacterium]